jgi:hypothetical protein
VSVVCVRGSCIRLLGSLIESTIDSVVSTITDAHVDRTMARLEKLPAKLRIDG